MKHMKRMTMTQKKWTCLAWGF